VPFNIVFILAADSSSENVLTFVVVIYCEDRK